MRVYRVLLPIVFAALTSVRAETNTPGQSIPFTNPVELLPYIANFGKALDLDLADPLTTNHVTRFSPARGPASMAGITIHGYLTFGFNVKDRIVISFTDRKHSMTVLWRPEDIKPLVQPSKITQQQAIDMAQNYLKRLGYSEHKMPVLPPKTKPWRWQPRGESTDETLPFFTVEWPWRDLPDRNYFTIEIDGIRKKVNYFSTAYKSSAEESLHTKPSSKAEEE